MTRKNRVKISTRNSKSKFRIGTFESELLSRNFRVEISSRKFQLEIQTRNFRLEILTRNSDLKFQVGTFRVGKFRLADEKTLSALAGPGCRKYCCVYFFALPLARALAVKNNVNVGISSQNFKSEVPSLNFKSEFRVKISSRKFRV